LVALAVQLVSGRRRFVEASRVTAPLLMPPRPLRTNLVPRRVTFVNCRAALPAWQGAFTWLALYATETASSSDVGIDFTAKLQTWIKLAPMNKRSRAGVPDLAHAG
jgi:hypothetical protein